MKTIGVVGGVGPEASNLFCQLLIKNQSAKKDQDHLPFIHFCNPQIPDRTDFIVGNGEDPTPELVKTCKTLEKSGADFLVIPCNTAHHFLSQVQDQVNIPIVDMTKVLVKTILSKDPPLRKIGILATTGSIDAKIYQNYFKIVGVETIIPTEEEQETLVMKSIYGNGGIKAGKKNLPKKRLTEMVNRLIERGAEAIVLGCTEIPLVLKQKNFDVRLYDPMNLASKEIIKYIEEQKAKEEVVTVRYVLEEIAIKVRAEIVTKKNIEKPVVAYLEEDSEELEALN